MMPAKLVLNPHDAHPMSLFNLFKTDATKPVSSASTYEQQPDKAGRLVTGDLETAIAECKAKVDRIAKECRAKNRKFRDTEFDLETDQQRCLHGLSYMSASPSDVLRVTQIFDKPQFFIEGASSNDLVQGGIGDCWFISALAVVSTADGLVDKCCVARDEQVGIYGFIFFRDGKWVNVIIDDLLYTQVPKWDELGGTEQLMYQNDKAKYEASARKGTQSLLFARSGTEGETWVPLIEKAFAKLHGSYAALEGGETGEGIEDLTGGVTTFIPSKDILDIEKFWTDELLKANKDRLFACAYMSGSVFSASGLIANHAYAVLRAVEVNGKQFVIVRNPWGKSEWTGPWSDGSKEWTTEWLQRLPEFGHSFGDDGQFVMEYKDFLNCWQQIDRLMLFDSSWVMSSHWLQVQAKPMPCAWSYGDVSFTVSMPKASPVIIVLSQLDGRYFKEIDGCYKWTFDFKIFKKGEKEPIASGESSVPYVSSRSVNLEMELEAGDYVVHVRLDRAVERAKDYYETGVQGWDQRILSRVLTQRAIGQSNASNFKAELQAQNLSIPLDILAGQDLESLEKKALALAEEKKKAEEEEAKKKAEEAEAKRKADEDAAKKAEEEAKLIAEAKEKGQAVTTVRTTTTTVETTTVTSLKAEAKEAGAPTAVKTDATAPSDTTPDAAKAAEEQKAKEEKEQAEQKAKEQKEKEEQNLKDHPEDSICIGLRVYSRNTSAVIAGQLRHEMEMSAKLALA
ncbi:hypothetical protein C8J56DRAFT_937820 [Mycena floridula]|nr:hypothetical protein C8J56DRAFT_937820 [Mycena floridula]